MGSTPTSGTTHDSCLANGPDPTTVSRAFLLLDERTAYDGWLPSSAEVHPRQPPVEVVARRYRLALYVRAFVGLRLELRQRREGVPLVGEPAPRHLLARLARPASCFAGRAPKDSW